MQYAHDDELRFELYKLFRQRGYPENEQVLLGLLRSRHELATLLRYRQYAEDGNENKMIKTAENAQEFIDRITDIADSRAQYDYEILLARQQELDPSAQVVGDWQKTYLEELIKQELFEIDSRELRSYFQYDRVRQGIFDLTEALFDEIGRAHV